MASSVSAISQGAENESIDQVTSWLAAARARGDIKPATVRTRITALKAIRSVLDVNEPRTPEAVLANLDDLVKRWANKHNQHGQTLTDYAGRCRTALQQYLAWKQDPAKFRAPPGRTPSRKPIVEANNKADVTPQPPRVSPGNTERRTLPLGVDRDPFVYELPVGGLTVKDIQRISYHLVTMANDYDASEGTPKDALMRVSSGPHI